MKLRHLGALGLALVAFVTAPATTAQEAGDGQSPDQPIGRIELRDEGPDQIRVFRSEPEAIDWLMEPARDDGAG